ncbi:MAG TPA: flagellar hook-basal body complex protein, partial [Noviherbaspirillum sp.]|nr:flagellar hook-basal body complex protein [Noviherbaspirillum sp.]
MSFQQGLSGLNAAAKSLETIGNNVANANTVGFKGSQAQFADVFASSLTGATATQIGIGTKLAQVSQQFTQGNITASSNPLDVAINGGGFFRLSTNGTITYSRNGQFQLDSGGYIVNSNGARLTGYVADARGVLSTGAPSELNIRTADLAPRATTGVTAALNLDSRMSPPIVPVFDMNEPTSYNSSSSVTVFDSLGNAHVLQTYYVKTDPTPPSTGGTWQVYASSNGRPLGAVDAVPATTAGNVVALGAPTSLSAIPAGTFSINGVAIGAVAAGADAAEQGANVAAAINAANIPGVTASADGAGVVTITNAGNTTISMNGAASSPTAASDAHADLLAATGFGAAQVGTQAV